MTGRVPVRTSVVEEDVEVPVTSCLGLDKLCLRSKSDALLVHRPVPPTVSLLTMRYGRHSGRERGPAAREEELDIVGLSATRSERRAMVERDSNIGLLVTAGTARTPVRAPGAGAKLLRPDLAGAKNRRYTHFESGLATAKSTLATSLNTLSAAKLLAPVKPALNPAEHPPSACVVWGYQDRPRPEMGRLWCVAWSPVHPGAGGCDAPRC